MQLILKYLKQISLHIYIYIYTENCYKSKTVLQSGDENSSLFQLYNELIKDNKAEEAHKQMIAYFSTITSLTIQDELSFSQMEELQTGIKVIQLMDVDSFHVIVNILSKYVPNNNNQREIDVSDDDEIEIDLNEIDKSDKIKIYNYVVQIFRKEKRYTQSKMECDSAFDDEDEKEQIERFLMDEDDLDTIDDKLTVSKFDDHSSNNIKLEQTKNGIISHSYLYTCPKCPAEMAVSYQTIEELNKHCDDNEFHEAILYSVFDSGS